MAAFKHFIIFAEMRTGSNFLEDNLNQFPDIACHGEVFNPHFIGYPSKDDLFGITQQDRDQNPMAVLSAIRDQSDGIGGFRFFHDHDVRAFEASIDDPAVAKVILTRNPLDSFISWKIASATGQWKLTNPTNRRAEAVHIDADEFALHMAKVQAFQIEILNRLQRSGQTGFYIAYEDLQDVEIINGLARFLGSNHRLEELSKTLKKQNPAPISDKVANYVELHSALVGMDQFNLTRTPNFEPRRGPMVPGYVGAAHAPLLFMPIKCGPDLEVRHWLAQLDGMQVSDLKSGFSQKTLRQWKRQNKGHRSFAVVRHPIARAYEAFCKHILPTGPGAFRDLRRTLRRVHNVMVPQNENSDPLSVPELRDAFAAFLIFVKANLSGQTAIRVDAAWASQSHVLQGFADFVTPDMVIREEHLKRDLDYLARTIGYDAIDIPKPQTATEIPLRDIYDDELESLARDAYQKDYLMFGFGPYRPD